MRRARVSNFRHWEGIGERYELELRLLTHYAAGSVFMTIGKSIPRHRQLKHLTRKTTRPGERHFDWTCLHVMSTTTGATVPETAKTH